VPRIDGGRRPRQVLLAGLGAIGRRLHS
jgi:hypothetical protein